MNLKALIEKRNAVIEKMEALVTAAEGETRAFSAKENEEYQQCKTEADDLAKTIAAINEQRAMEKSQEIKKPETTEEAETRAFMNYINSQCGLAVETRAGEQNIAMAENGAIIPATIANKIISAVKEICPIFAGVTMFAVKGTLKIPVWGSSGKHDIAVGYQNEFTDITADSGKFTSVDLTGYLAGALTLVGKSVINNSEINVLDFVISEMSKQIAVFIEKELLIGTTGKATGALSTATTLNAGSISTITADNLIELQSKIPTAYQSNACWTISPATFLAIKKLKDSNGQYLLQTQASIVNAFPYTLLGKPVFISDNMPAIAGAAKAVLYGDYSGLGVNMRQQIEMQILNEKYATQHAVGIVAWFEFDSKVIDSQKLATLVMSA